ncbi:hypothetical protein F2Q70_00042737 [Brassica cretica]|uniref:Lon N-terminal domain-containing protein n=1 Tax=Brassica cretica TaxID=69181 RepID=A0A8S9KG98_BRACR|nr:hypothetical protein F2Q70_00042737 [Brassica cretica]
MNDISKELKLFARSRCKEDTATFGSQLRVQRAILRGDFRSLQKDLGDEIGSVRNLTFPDFCSHQEHSVTTYKNQLVLSKPETLIPFERKCSFRSLAFQPLYSESTFNLKAKVVALPFLSKPLIPGFYMPLYVKDPKVLAALQESKRGQAAYAGAFLLKDDKNASSSSSFETVNTLDKLKGKELLNKIHQGGTLAHVTYHTIQGEQVILFGRKRLQITEMVNETPLTVKTHHIKDKPYDKDDKDIIKATFEADLEGQTDPDRADILWEASSISGLKVHRKDLDFNGWIFCCLGFSEAGRHSSSAVLS